MNKNILYLGLTSFFTDFATALINPILPIFIVVYLHESMEELGIVVAVATFFSYALRIISGYISDRFGIVKPLVVAGYALSAISKPLIGFANGYKSVAALRALERTGKALRSAPKDELISKSSKKRVMGKSFGFHKTLDIAGEFSGTIALFLILFFLGKSESVIRNIFFFSAIPGVLGLLIVIFFVKDIKKTKKSFKLYLEDKKAAFGLSWYFFYLIFFFSDAYYVMAAKENGIDMAFIPLLFIVSTGVQTLTSFLSGSLIDRFGEKKILLLSFVFGLFAQVLIYLGYIWPSFVFLGLFTVFSLNAVRVYIAKTAKNVASLYGFFYASYALFAAIGAYAIGYLWHNFGMNISMLFSITGIFLITLIFFLRTAFVRG